MAGHGNGHRAGARANNFTVTEIGSIKLTKRIRVRISGFVHASSLSRWPLVVVSDVLFRGCTLKCDANGECGPLS